MPMIGASGAIAGVLGGYVMLYPRAKVVTFVAHPVPVAHPGRAGVGLPRHLVPRAVPHRTNSGVAWMAHVGGFLGRPGRRAAARGTRPQPPTRGAEVEYLPPPRRGHRW